MNLDKAKICYHTSKLIAENMAAEGEAIEKYMELLNCCEYMEEGNKLIKELCDAIREIVSDEKNHLATLQSFLKKFDGDIKPAKD